MSEEQSIGELLDTLYLKRAERLEKEREVAALKSEEMKLSLTILGMLKESNLEGAKGKLATATVSTAVQAKVTDWDAFWEYTRKENAHDLIQKRVSITAVRARWGESIEVPGLEPIEITSISLTKRR